MVCDAHDSPAADLSVVIPARNEAAGLPDTLRAVCAEGPREVFVVDGASTDQTAAVARAHGAEVVRAPPGRGGQLNAAPVTRRMLLFLHADTRPPPGYPLEIAETLGRPGVVAGAFRLAVHAPEHSFRWIERSANWRSRWLGLPYGDQGLFLSRAVFEAAGGFPSLPVMEDHALIRKLQRRGRIALAKSAALTSGRRWQQGGLLRVALLNHLCLAAYGLGVPPERIARWREGATRKAAREKARRRERVLCDEEL